MTSKTIKNGSLGVLGSLLCRPKSIFEGVGKSLIVYAGRHRRTPGTSATEGRTFRSKDIGRHRQDSGLEMTRNFDKIFKKSSQKVSKIGKIEVLGGSGRPLGHLGGLRGTWWDLGIHSYLKKSVGRTKLLHLLCGF